jgi:hypothetical protein
MEGGGTPTLRDALALGSRILALGLAVVDPRNQTID